MYPLFLETVAARQVDEYCRQHPDEGLNAEEVKKSLYRNGLAYRYKWCEELCGEDAEKATTEYDNWWVGLCLKNDSHKAFDVDSLCCWLDTPEGQQFWHNISKVGWEDE